MLGQLCILLLSGCIILSPVFFWAYVFLSGCSSALSRKQFFTGVIVGGVITGIFSYANSSMYLTSSLKYVFSSLERGEYFSLTLGLIAFIGLLAICIGGILGVLYRQKKNFLLSYVQSILLYGVMICISVAIIYLASSIFVRQIGFVSLSFLSYSFMSFGVILSYYIIVSLIEESMKYFPARGSLRDTSQIRLIDFIALGSAVGLGFAFSENLVYAYSYIQQYSVNAGLLQIVFFRSIFTIILHIVGVIFMCTGFWFILFSLKSRFYKLRAFLTCGLFSIISHALFDVSLTYNYVGFIFLYIVIMYLTLTYLTNYQEG